MAKGGVARGWSDRVAFETALARILDTARSIGHEAAPLEQCCGRVLAEDVVAGRDVPPYPRSAVDGFAVFAGDLAPATPDQPVELEIDGSVRPGEGPPRRLRVGTAVRVSTGAPLPEGTDAVVMIEDAEASGQRASFVAKPKEGKHLIAVGEDVKTGETVLRRGRRIRPQDLGVVASLELDALLVVRRPRVRVLATGDELVPLGQPRTGTKIVDTNSLVVQRLAERDGAVLAGSEHVGDDPTAIGAAMSSADYDVLLVSGGSSAGAEDHAPRVLEKNGELVFHGVSVRPGGPACFGLVAERPVFLLPGHPLACLAAYELFAGPLIQTLGGRPAAWPHRTVQLVLREPVESAAGRTDYVRVTVDRDGATPLKHHTGASNLSSAVRADGAVLVPSAAEHLLAGETVTVFLYD